MTRYATPATRVSVLIPSVDAAQVSDVMRHGVISCSPQTALTDIARMMTSHHVHAIIVLRDEPDGDTTPWGVVSDLDVLATVHPGAEDLTAGQVAGTPAVMIAPDDSLVRAAQLMRENETSHLIVVERQTGQPIGVISTLDIAGALAWGEA
jgi:CBS domain-containing protein